MLFLFLPPPLKVLEKFFYCCRQNKSWYLLRYLVGRSEIKSWATSGHNLTPKSKENEKHIEDQINLHPGYVNNILYMSRGIDFHRPDIVKQLGAHAHKFSIILYLGTADKTIPYIEHKRYEKHISPLEFLSMRDYDHSDFFSGDFFDKHIIPRLRGRPISARL